MIVAPPSDRRIAPSPGTLAAMATDKRERQRANRETKKAAEAKKKRRSDAFALAKKWALYGLLIVVVFVIANLLLG